ncbi:hypothetical protein JOC77_003155 [Peribacillus deserti]|uniref:HicB-like antitoxin of toxin-antitoxin system domain-containing protein n=1 Tax=Peribacillus deserti TaxID=673318 RepID=A0ABS2QKM0_9BACI|nr:hypothetical protein [Peribacillus deserti]MBM7693711.1 hypothetical protein [Peribacillus deserti]
MEINYKIAIIYIDNFDSLLYFVPVYDADRGIVEMDTFFELGNKASDEELEDTTIKTLKLCHTKEPDIKKAPIQQIKKAKSYKKATEKIKMVEVLWDKDEGFSVGFFEREKSGYFSLLDRIYLGGTVNKGEFAYAIRKAIELAR